jgi:indolepyruvate ferredoxin oxidoreductase
MTSDNQDYSLNDKYTTETGTIILTGVQALVRLPLDQHRADKRAGLNTATFISGYRGSPVGTLDSHLEQAGKLLDAHQVTFVPGVNEDLGATAVWGSQMAAQMPQPKYDGVLGMWYGKSPGVDRTGDVFKHANFFGIGRYGGVLAVAGDDPVAKSSTLPGASEVALYDAYMPVLYPGSIEEIIRYGRYGFELSRYSGLWTGFKIVTNLADAYCTAEVYPIDDIVRPAFEWNGRPWAPTQDARLVAPYTLDLEREIAEGRLKAAQLFAATNTLNRITVSGPDDRIGFIAPGKTYYDLREALEQVGLDEAALRRQGIRLLQIGLVSPLEPEIIRTFARGLESVVVIEEKRAFIEMFVRDILYGQTERPQVLGKTDAAGEALVPAYGELDPDKLAPILRRALGTAVAELAPAAAPAGGAPILLTSLPQAVNRQPYFCSGCPHNRSTNVPDGSIAGGGIGCHGMVLTMDRNTWGITHMGGEGAQWVGASHFSDMTHMYQNLGDGTLFHSGYLAIRQAVAAGTNITYKILYNTAVAMTGGQPVDGGMAVPELTRALQAEGVGKIIVLADDTDKYARDARWAAGIDIWPREDLDKAQETLRDTPGVTVLIYDQACAADLRRKRRRGLEPDPPMRVYINERVCEGCGDCGVKSNCLSVFPVETEFGRKTMIHQSSCNKDYTCLEGDCPAFITVLPDEAGAKSQARALPEVAIAAEELPEPPARPDEANIYMTGIGGTGVVTVNQVLGTAALLAGKTALSLDQTGLSQKGGPVVSHLKVLAAERPIANKIGRGQADAFLMFDVLTGTTEANLSRGDKARTTAIVSMSNVPTGKMVANTAVSFPQNDLFRYRLQTATRMADNVTFDAIELAETLFGNHMMANMMVVGAAYQKGLLPMSAADIEQAITLNRVAVAKNTQAFRYGRLLVADPERAAEMAAPPAAPGDATPLSPAAKAIVDGVGAEGELRRLLEIRVPELIAYQNEAYARDYAAFVRRTLAAELALGTAETPLSEAVARYLFKLMAFKDEYEVARLHLKADIQADIAAQFGPKAKITYKLHPPFVRALGVDRKIGFGKWFDSGYKLLYSLRRLRYTPFDVFGLGHVRKVERQLIDEYRALIEAEVAELSPDTLERAVALAELPDIIRGYEDIKMANVARYHEQIARIKGEAAVATAAD